MRRLISGRLAIAVGCALATATFTGVALAGGGNSDNAPGQQKKTEAAQTQVQPAQQQQQQATVSPSGDHTSRGQEKKDDAAASSQTQAQAQSGNQSPGQSKKAGAAASSDTQAGVKPSSTTTKWTHCRTGGAGTGTATCTAQAGTPATKADVSKRYGNGKTAAQIAVSRGAPDGTLITGPGNSQPHKVTVCGKPNNKSGGVDVHAVKSYDASACQPKTTQPTPPAEQTQVTQVCGQKTTVTSSTQVVGVLHGKHEHLMTNSKSAHFTKHDDKKVVETKTETKVEATGETCGTSQPTTPVTPTPVTPAPVTPAPVTPAPVTPAPVTPAPVTPAPVRRLRSRPAAANAQGSPNTSPSQNASGVLGANATIVKPKPAGGVLGSVANVAGGTLPFTGFPVWVALLLALALIAAGLMVWRRGSSPTRI